MFDKVEKMNYLARKLQKAVQNEDWEGVASLIELNPDIMEESLKLVYPILPPLYRFYIPTNCYTHNGDRMPAVRKYVRLVPYEMAILPEVQVYRAGTEFIDKAKYSISWTTSLDVAKWFYDRSEDLHWPKRHLYRGVIDPEKVICFTDDRHEQEVMQYNAVRNIVEIER